MKRSERREVRKEVREVRRREVRKKSEKSEMILYWFPGNSSSRMSLASSQDNNRRIGKMQCNLLKHYTIVYITAVISCLFILFLNRITKYKKKTELLNKLLSIPITIIEIGITWTIPIMMVHPTVKYNKPSMFCYEQDREFFCFVMVKCIH